MYNRKKKTKDTLPQMKRRPRSARHPTIRNIGQVNLDAKPVYFISKSGLDGMSVIVLLLMMTMRLILFFELFERKKKDRM